MTTIKKLFVAIAMILVPLVANAIEHVMKKDIVDTAVENGSFKTLVATVKAAGLVDTLKGRAIYRFCSNGRRVCQTP